MPYLAKLSARLNAVWTVAAVVASALALPARAQSSHRVTIEVPEVESLAVSPDAVRLVFATPPAGQPFADVTEASAYAVTVNTAGNKITGALDAAYDAGLRLRVRLEPPPGARGLGLVELGPVPRDLVADVGQTAGSGLSIAYTASADMRASGSEASRTVTYTVTDQ